MFSYIVQRVLADGSASKLPCVVFRTALLAVLRSKKFHGETIGIMITASHNPAIVCLVSLN